MARWWWDGDDERIGSDRTDFLFGGRGDDILRGRGGNDFLFGGRDDDSLFGGQGFDILFGGRGNDRLEGGADDDLLFGGRGFDTAVYAGSFFDYEIVVGRHATRVTDMEPGLAGDEGTDLLFGVEALLFEEGGAILGDEGDEAVDGTAESDVIDAGGGDDMVDAGAGDDVISYTVGDGTDVVDGGADDDTVVVSGLAAIPTLFLIQPGGPVPLDHIAISVNGELALDLDNVEDLVIRAGDLGDSVILQGDFSTTDLAPTTIVFEGGAGNDVFDGGAMTSTEKIEASGAGGDDSLIGAGGDDSLDGGAGDDDLDGGLGIDTAIYAGNFGSFTILQPGPGSLTVTDDVGTEGSDDLTSIEVLQFADLTASLPSDVTLDNASVDENAPGAAIGNIAVVDPDLGDSHSFLLSDGRFEVVGGVLKLKPGESLDSGIEPVVPIDVTATDSTGLSVTRSFAIAVNDLNDDPVLQPAGPFAIDERVGATGVQNGDLVGQVAATDDDPGAVLSYAIVGGSGQTAFAIDAASGEITVADVSQLDFEVTPSFTLDIEVTDGLGGSDVESYTVELNDLTGEIYFGGIHLTETTGFFKLTKDGSVVAVPGSDITLRPDPPGSTFDSDPRELVEFQGDLYLTALDQASRLGLFKVEGDSGVLEQVDILPGQLDPEPFSLMMAGDDPLFIGLGGATGNSLYYRILDDGSVELITEPTPGGFTGLSFLINQKAVEFQDETYFLGFSNEVQFGLGFLKVDTNGDVVPVPGATDLPDQEKIEFQGDLYFFAGGVPTTLQRIEASTGLVEDVAVIPSMIASPGTVAQPDSLTVHDNALFFMAREEVAGGFGEYQLFELMPDDSLVQVTTELPGGFVGLSQPKIPQSFPIEPALVSFGGELYFEASDATATTQLFKLNAAGSVVPVAGLDIVTASEFVELLGDLYFVGTTAGGDGLFKVEGTSGAVEAVEILPGALEPKPSLLTPIGDELFFVAAEDDGGALGEQQLFKVMADGSVIQLTTETPGGFVGIDLGPTDFLASLELPPIAAMNDLFFTNELNDVSIYPAALLLNDPEGAELTEVLDWVGTGSVQEVGLGLVQVSGVVENFRYGVEVGGEEQIATVAVGRQPGTTVVGDSEAASILFAAEGVDSTLIGGSGDDLLDARDGNDLLIGGGGADSLLGGPGDDVLVVSDEDFQVAFGRNGTDTLRFDGGIELDLRDLAEGRIQAVEVIDLGTGGAADASRLVVDLASVLTVDPDGGQLTVLGDASDVLEFTDGWSGPTDLGNGFDSYTQGGTTLLVDQDMVIQV